MKDKDLHRRSRRSQRIADKPRARLKNSDVCETRNEGQVIRHARHTMNNSGVALALKKREAIRKSRISMNIAIASEDCRNRTGAKRFSIKLKRIPPRKTITANSRSKVRDQSLLAALTAARTQFPVRCPVNVRASK